MIEAVADSFDSVNQVPDVLRRRTLSLRAFDADGMMLDADLVEGVDIEGLIDRLFAEPQANSIHVHFAKRGCDACRIERA